MNNRANSSNTPSDVAARIEAAGQGAMNPPRQYAYKVGPISWSVETTPAALSYRGGVAKGTVALSAVKAFGVADLTGALGAELTQDQSVTQGLARLVGAGAMGQLLLIHEPAPGKRKTAYVNLDLGNPDCTALVDDLRAQLPDRYAGFGPMGVMQKRMGISGVRGILLFAAVVAIAAAGLGYFLLHQ